ncbi:MAG: OmpA family protein [Bdellovibrionia bacterium]
MMITARTIRPFAWMALSALLVYGSGCASGQKKSMEDSPISIANADENSGMGDSDSGNAMGLQTVHFAYDDSALDDQAKSILDANAEILKNNPSVRVQIEGHCDQRGGVQYNIALGEKRAKVSLKYLKGLGISDDRLSIISLGKEKPVDPSTSEEAYARNRRDNFVITSK